MLVCVLNNVGYFFVPFLRNGDLAASAIKQVASGRFGVTPEYLVSAQQASAALTLVYRIFNGAGGWVRRRSIARV